MRTVVALASLVSAAALRVPARAGPVHMSASKGPFLIPQQPANFAGAQWAPECFKPFPINVKPAANAIKELMEEAGAPAAAAVVEAPAAPPAEAAPVDADKTTFTVTLKNPDGDQVFECPPDMNILDQTDELDVTGDLPYACRAGSCSACAGKLVSGTMDTSGCSFLSDEQKADGWVLTCSCIPTSDCVIETHKEDDMY